MQLSNERNIINRMLYYWAKTFSSQLKRGESFQKLVRTIGIVITDFEIEEIEGIEKGKSEKTIEIAKKMKTKKINMDSIIEITGLTKEEIEKL